MALNELQQRLCDESTSDYSDLRAVFINCTLKRSPEISHTEGLMSIARHASSSPKEGRRDER